MLKTTIVLFAAILIYVVVFEGIACLLLPVGSFQSLEQKSEIQVLPLFATDPAQYFRYRPKLYFRDGQFTLQESDYFFSGPYACRFGRVVASHSNGSARSVGYTPLLGAILWDGKFYFNLLQILILGILLFLGRRIRERFRQGSG